MKHPIHLALAAACLLAPAIARAQITIPSDGSDGALNVTTANLQIDLSQAVTGTWSDSNTANAGKGIWDPAKRAIVFKYSSVNIASGRTVTFRNHPNRPPVVWLVQGNVTIAGTVSLDGATSTGNYLLAEPGPGGYRGGARGTNNGAGLGPGGGNGGASNAGFNGTYASAYGNPSIVPLIGGSGGGAGSIYNSAGGGGAILIACSGTINLIGTVTATGGSGGFSAGSDGAVRFVANSITGAGLLDLRYNGRIRLEANSVSGSLITIPQTIAVAPANPPVIWPADDAPKCRIIQVDDQATPLNPTAPLDLAADVGLNANAGQVVTIQTNNFPTTGTVQVRAAGKFTAAASLINATFQAGDANQATWTATVPFATGFTTLQARAFVPAAP